MATATGPVTLELVLSLYREHARALGAARAAQRALYAQRSDARLERFFGYRWLAAGLRALGLPAHYKRRLRPKFDDIEAEVTYLLVRAGRPAVALEIAPYYGWSTTWLLRALRDNGTGRLRSYDLVDYSRRTVPRELAEERWEFTHGDIRDHVAALPAGIGYLFLDAAHTVEFARWYLEALFPRLPAGTLVGVHDVFRRADLAPMPESAVLLEWLERRRVPWFTAAPARSAADYERIVAVKRELGLAEPIHRSTMNPMVFFRLL
jgi:predicted O-methyltransferase YrrM